MDNKMQSSINTATIPMMNKLYSLTLLAGALSHFRELSSLLLNGHPNADLTLVSIGLHIMLLACLFGMQRKLRVAALGYAILTVTLFLGFPEMTSLGRVAGNASLSSLPAYVWCGYIVMDTLPILGTVLTRKTLR